MHQTPQKTYDEIMRERPFCERQAILHDHECHGRSTFEHAWLYRGRQISDKWAVIRLCYWSHLGPGLNKRINEWISLRHAEKTDLAKYPNKDWEQIRKYLNKLYDRKRI